MALGTVPFVFPHGATPDPLDLHVIALPPADDPDQDFLASGEEVILGMDPHQFDANTNAVPDGIDLARELAAAIDALPTEPSATQPYVTHFPMMGVESCEVCQESINMGCLVITNPLENQQITVHYVTKHFLEHGSFTYSGSLNSGRLNPATLKLVLTSNGKAHLIAGPWSSGPVFHGDGTELVFREDREAGVTAKFFKVVAW